MNTSKTESIPHAHSDEIDLLDILIILAKRKKVIVLLPVVAAIVMAGASFMLPNTYKASAKLLPPQQSQSTASSMLSQLGGLGSLAAGAVGLKNPSEVYVGMLKSVTLADRIIANFDLQKVFGTKSKEQTRIELAQSTTVTAGKDGFIVIEVATTDAKLAADLTNSYVAELTALTRKLAVTDASQRRVFFESQLLLAKNNLVKAEMSLKQNLGSRGLISVDSQSMATVETSARLRAQISAKEVALNAMKQFVTPNQNDYKVLATEITSLRAELAKLEYGTPGEGQAQSAEVSKDAFENIQRMRDLKYYQMLYEILAKQYEAARLDEAKEPALIQVLDPAIVPENKFKPNRGILVIGAFFATLILSIIGVLVYELIKKAENTPNIAGRMAQLKAYLRLR